MSFRTIDVKAVDMEEGLYQDAIRFAFQALDCCITDQQVATYIKNRFDNKYGPLWHCVVGKQFGTYVTYRRKHYIHFCVGAVSILLFKSN